MRCRCVGGAVARSPSVQPCARDGTALTHTRAPSISHPLTLLLWQLVELMARKLSMELVMLSRSGSGAPTALRLSKAKGNLVPASKRVGGLKSPEDAFVMVRHAVSPSASALALSPSRPLAPSPSHPLTLTLQVPRPKAKNVPMAGMMPPAGAVIEAAA